MEIVRCDMDEDLHEIVGEVRSYFDWRAYVRKYPWICLSTAFAAGYLMVPKKSFRKLQIPHQTFSTADLPPSTALNQKSRSTLITLVGNLALRGITAYLEKQVVNFATAYAAEAKSENREEDPLCKPFEESQPIGSSAATPSKTR
jgi:hypothetical protein